MYGALTGEAYLLDKPLKKGTTRITHALAGVLPWRLFLLLLLTTLA